MRILSRALIVAMIAMLIAGSVAAQETPEPEPLTTAQRRAVSALSDSGILDGTSCLVEECSGNIERWEVALWIVRLLDSEPTENQAFADIEAEMTYGGHVEALFDLGVTVGCMVDPLRYCPTRSTSRGEMAAFVTRAYDLEETLPPHGFADVPETHNFRDNISALRNAGVLTADCADGSGLFCPEDPIMAAEAVEWLYRASRLNPSDGETGGGGGGDAGGRGGGGGNGGGGGGRGNTGGGNTGGGNTGGGGTPGTNPPDTTQPPLIPTLTGNDGIDLVNGECTHHDRHLQGDSNDRKSYMILDGNYAVSLVFDDNGPYASVAEHQEFFRHDALPPNTVANYRYRVELNTLRDVYFTHWHDGANIRWVYWIPETVLERVEDIADPMADEVLFEDGSGNQYRRLRNARGGLDYGPFDSPPACNDHSHPPETGNYLP